jgi:hypothetical protein
VPARRSPQITPRSLTEGYDHFGVWPQLRKAAKKLACGSYFWDGNEKVLIKPMLMSTQNYSLRKKVAGERHKIGVTLGESISVPLLSTNYTFVIASRDPVK